MSSLEYDKVLATTAMGWWKASNASRHSAMISASGDRGDWVGGQTGVGTTASMRTLGIAIVRSMGGLSHTNGSQTVQLDLVTAV